MRMTTLNTDDPSATIDWGSAAFEDPDDPMNVLAVASIALSGLGFLTLLRLADRRDRTPASALGLFLVTSLATISGTVFGLVAASRERLGAARQGVAPRSFGSSARYRHESAQLQLDEDEAPPLVLSCIESHNDRKRMKACRQL